MAGRVSRIYEEFKKSLYDPSKPWTSILSNAEMKTGINRLYLLSVSISIVSFWLVYGYGPQLLCNLIGFLYPAYKSMHAIENEQRDEYTKWLIFWVVFAIFSLAEYFVDSIVAMFPLYWLLKCVLMVWLVIPSEYNGSLLLYQRIIRPYFLQHHVIIDDTLDNVRKEAIKILQKHN